MTFRQHYHFIQTTGLLRMSPNKRAIYDGGGGRLSVKNE